MMRAWIAIFVASIAACVEGPAAEAPKRAMSAYQGHATELFADAIEPRAVGLELEGVRNPKTDPTLRARTEAADAVVRVRITTITSRQELSGPTYEIGFRIVDQIAGPYPPPIDFTIELAPRAQAFGIVRHFEDRLVAMNLTFVAFVRGFARAGAPDGEMHFHLAPDTKDVLAAVIEAAALAELK